MNKDQKLLQEAYQRIYESFGSFHDDRLTEKEELFVDKAVNAIIEGYPKSLKNYEHIFIDLAKAIFKDISLIIATYVSAICKIIGNHYSNFNQMHEAGLIILNNEKDKEELKENFKRQVAASIADLFSEENSHSVLSMTSETRAYLKERAKELRDKKINRKADKELQGSGFDIDVLKDF